MALPAINRPLTAPVPITPRQGTTQGGKEEASNDLLRATPRRAGDLHIAMSMQDDASALAAALLRNRGQQTTGGARESQAWIDHVLDDKVHDKLVRLHQLLDGMRSPVQLLGLLKQMFSDPSDMLAVLRALLADDELKALRELLEMSLEQLLEEQASQGNSAALKGGLNVAIKARLAAGRGQLSARQLRQSYRDLLGNPQDGIGEYAAWIGQYGFNNRSTVLSFMEQALGTDMFSLDPSGSRVEFGTLLSQVRNLTVLRSVDELLVRETTRTGLIARMATTAEAVVIGLLDVVRGLQDWPGLFSGPLANARLVLALHERAGLVQALRRALAGLPDAVWIDSTAREVAADGLDAMVVESIARERLQPGRAGGVMA